MLGSSSSTPQNRWYIYLQVGKIFRWTCIKRIIMNAVQSSPLIGVLGWKDSHNTLIEINLPIILYLYSRWPFKFYLFMLSILKVACNQIWYVRPLFYIIYLLSRIYNIKVLISCKNHMLKCKKPSNNWFSIE